MTVRLARKSSLEIIDECARFRDQDERLHHRLQREDYSKRRHALA
jgi:hypothetical protein